jgi:hypothetical protein
MWPPRSPASHGALPPEGVLAPWGGPAALKPANVVKVGRHDF